MVGCLRFRVFVLINRRYSLCTCFYDKSMADRVLSKIQTSYRVFRCNIVPSIHQSLCQCPVCDSPRRTPNPASDQDHCCVTSWQRLDTFRHWTIQSHSCSADDFQISRFSFPLKIGT
jgi:hypothetical protein